MALAIKPVSLEEVLRKELSSKYHVDEMMPVALGDTRELYVVPWGPAKRLMMVKVDGTPNTPRGIRHYQAGCDTENELDAKTGIEGAEKHHWLGLHDYIDLTQYGFGIGVVEPFIGSVIDGKLVPAETLKQRVARKPFSKQEYRRFALQSVDAVSYVHSQGWFTRDNHSQNILITGADKSLEAIHLDQTNACRRDHPAPKALPTAGKHWILDPLLVKSFTGAERAYNHTSELYALAVNLLFAANGRYAVECDPDKKTLTEVASGKSLLLPAGTIDTAAYERAIEAELGRMPKWLHRLRPVLQRMLTVDEDHRYMSLDIGVNDCEDALAPSALEKVLTDGALKPLAAVGAIALLSTLSMFQSSSEARRYREQLWLDSAYSVDAHVNTWDLSVTNNLFTMKTTVNYQDYHEDPSNQWRSAVHAHRGDTLRIQLSGEEIPRRRTLPQAFSEFTPSLRGRVYIEGFKADSFFFHARAPQRYPSEHGDYGPSTGTLIIPQDMPAGAYTLVGEVLAPNKELIGSGIDDPPNNITNTSRLHFTPRQVIARQRIPIIIAGDNAQQGYVHLQNAKFEWPEEWLFMESIVPDWHMHPYARTAVSMLGENYQQDSLVRGLDLPVFSQTSREGPAIICSHDSPRECTVENASQAYLRAYGGKPGYPSDIHRILQVASYSGGSIVSLSYIPIAQEAIPPGGPGGMAIVSWHLAPPAGDFAEQALHARQQLFLLRDERR